MRSMSRARSLVFVALVTLSASGCGGSGDDSCQPPNLDGSVAFAQGTATLTGNGALPDGIANGLELQLLLKQGGASTGVIPDNLFNANDRICGKGFHYTVKKIEPGTYRLTFEVHDPNTQAIDTVFQGEAPSDFTVAEGQTLNLDTTFQMVP